MQWIIFKIILRWFPKKNLVLKKHWYFFQFQGWFLGKPQTLQEGSKPIVHWLATGQVQSREVTDNLQMIKATARSQK